MSIPAPSYQINGQSVSAQHFYATACHPDRAVAIEACAGAGKTWMLVSRIVRALLAGAMPEQILAITFTKKAAAEMSERLQQWLALFAVMSPEQLAQELKLRGMPAEQAQQHAPALRDLYLHLLQHGRPVQIRTFHSWFSALLRAAPLQLLQQLGLPTEYELVEDEARITPWVWQPFYAAVRRDAQALVDYRALVDTHGRSNTRKALENALSRRTEFALADAAPDVLKNSVPHFSEFFEEMHTLEQPSDWLLQRQAGRAILLAAAQALGAAQSKTCKEAAVKLEQAVGQNDWENVHSALLTKDNTPLKYKNSVISDKASVDAAQKAAQQVHRAQQQHAAWQHQQRMVRLSRLLNQVYADIKRNRGWIDMNDIETAARALLQDSTLSGWLQERLDAQVRHLLIDEFQDTNPLQWQALHTWLQSYAGAAQAPSVFIVGDPKQSIYRFRRAAPEVFEAAKAFIQQGLGGDLLSCDHTRRNAPAVIAAINAVMLSAQQKGNFAGFRTHTTAATGDGYVLALPRINRPDKSTASVTNDTFWRNSLTTPQTSPEELLRTRESRQAASWLVQWLNAGMPADEVLVLARKNSTLVAMQQALSEQGILAELADKSQLADAPEIQDIVALVDALISPRHDLSLARALRSPLFSLDEDILTSIALGVQAAALAPHTNSEHHVSWLTWLLEKTNGTNTSAPANCPLAPIAVQLHRWQIWLQQLPPHDALDAIYRDGNVLQHYASATPSAMRARVLERLRALPGQTLALDGGRYANAYDWVRSMRTPTGERAPAHASPNAVRLLTVHGAKGLEASLVLLLNTDAEQNRTKSMEILVDWPGNLPHPQQLVFIASGAHPPPSAEILALQENQAATNEEYNAWYVAMTRARRVLSLSAIEPYRTNQESWWQQMQTAHTTDPAPLHEDDYPCLTPAQCALAVDVHDIQLKEQAHQHLTTLSPPDAASTDNLLPFLPELPHALRYGSVTMNAINTEPTQELQAALGEAMHRMLEWHRPDAPLASLSTFTIQRSLSTQYCLTAEQVFLVMQRAQTILQGEGAWAWDTKQLQWQANEIDIAWQGQSGRIDRLVCRKSHDDMPATWWVLDFKSALNPQMQPELQQQLRRYQQAIQHLHPQEPVRAAFLTAKGKLIELP